MEEVVDHMSQAASKLYLNDAKFHAKTELGRVIVESIAKNNGIPITAINVGFIVQGITIGMLMAEMDLDDLLATEDAQAVTFSSMVQMNAHHDHLKAKRDGDA